MKKETAITLTSLVIYIVVMLMAIGVISSISLMFYNNTNNLDDKTREMIEYNNFNSYFIKEIKTANNKVDKIGEDGTYILFTTGNSFSLKDNKILYNNLEIARDVKNINFKYFLNSNNQEEKTILSVEVIFNNYSKKMNYKIEDIY